MKITVVNQKKLLNTVNVKLKNVDVMAWTSSIMTILSFDLPV